MMQQPASILLSPPISPFMAAYHQDSEIREWSSHRSKSRSSTPSPLTDRAKFESTEASRDMESYSMEHRPLLRSHKTYPYVPRPLIPSSQNRQPSIERREPPYPMTYASTANLRTGVDDLESGCASAVPLSRSAPGSPISRLTPTSAEEDEGDAEDEDDLEVNMVEHDESGNVPRTAAELRAEKRKMKRFRLTHNQTRFLMSEFARQAHPDAAHRERLSREIPGLSPRQVQVWFQNRRAKLKRLTTDDRERMMRSRALPDDFDTTQALHSPYGSTHAVGTALVSPSTYPPIAVHGEMGQAGTPESLRRSSGDDTMSPSSINKAFGNFAFTPPGSAIVSPVSSSSEAYQHINHAQGLANASKTRTNPFTNSAGPMSSYHPCPQIPRLNTHERISQSRVESLGSPLRSSMSYTGGSISYGAYQLSAGQESSSFIGEQSSESEEPRSSSGRHDFPCTAGYQHTNMQGFHSSALARNHPSSTTIPRNLEIRSQLNSSQNPLHSQLESFSGFQSAPLAVPHDYQFLQLSAPHHILSFGTLAASNETPERVRNVASPGCDHYREGTSNNTQERTNSLQPGFSDPRRGSSYHEESYTNPFGFSSS